MFHQDPSLFKLLRLCKLWHVAFHQDPDLFKLLRLYKSWALCKFSILGRPFHLDVCLWFYFLPHPLISSSLCASGRARAVAGLYGRAKLILEGNKDYLPMGPLPVFFFQRSRASDEALSVIWKHLQLRSKRCLLHMQNPGTKTRKKQWYLYLLGFCPCFCPLLSFYFYLFLCCCAAASAQESLPSLCLHCGDWQTLDSLEWMQRRCLAVCDCVRQRFWEDWEAVVRSNLNYWAHPEF